MNVWTALPRLLVSSRCPDNVRFLVEKNSSSSIRHNSTNTAVSSKPPSKALGAIPTENWLSEPWSANLQKDDRPEESDRPSPPHILEHVIFSEGTLNPSVTNGLVDVPTVVEHLPVARLCHGLERVLFKYVNLPLARLS
jgi:hypothetical protein